MAGIEADLEIAVNAVREAGAVVMKAFRTDQKVTYKTPDQPLTEADLAADALLKHHLLGRRPKYGWLSEETADTPDRLQCKSVWVVDPIDGTRSFVAGRAEFAISVGLARAGQVLLGVLYNPATDEMFTAVRGKGAVGPNGQLSMPTGERRSLIAASRSEIRRGEFETFADGYDLVPTGSTAYKLAKVADGSADVFLSRGQKMEWDVCAGDLIVREAGGQVTDITGAPLQYNRPEPHIMGIIAARAPLHADVVQRLTSLPA